MSDVSRSPCLFGVCNDNETIPYWSGDTTLGGKVGWGAAQTDNEGQTLADFSLVAVGGWCLEATAAGGFQHEPAEAKAEGKAEEKGEERLSHQIWLKKKPQKTSRNEKGNGSLQKINKDTWTTSALHTEAGSFLFCRSDLDT